MNSRAALYLQAIRGPVLLVTAGVLFAIHQAGALSFSRTWPLLIIVIGVMKLLERAWAPAGSWQNAPSAYPSSKAYAPFQNHPATSGQSNDAGQPPQGPGAVEP